MTPGPGRLQAHIDGYVLPEQRLPSSILVVITFVCACGLSVVGVGATLAFALAAATTPGVAEPLIALTTMGVLALAALATAGIVVVAALMALWMLVHEPSPRLEVGRHGIAIGAASLGWDDIRKWRAGLDYLEFRPRSGGRLRTPRLSADERDTLAEVARRHVKGGQLPVPPPALVALREGR